MSSQLSNNENKTITKDHTLDLYSRASDDREEKSVASDDFFYHYHERSRQVQSLGFLPRVQQGSITALSISTRGSTAPHLIGHSPSIDISTSSIAADQRISKIDSLTLDHSYVGSKQSMEEVALSSPYSVWKNPFSLSLMSIFLAWIYIIIPCTNFWVYTLVKCELWVLLAIFSVCEFEDFCLPDALPVTYHSAYLLAFIGVIVIRVAQGLSGQENNFILNAVYFNVINVSVTVMYAIDVFIWNPAPLPKSVDEEDVAEVEAERVTATEVDVYLQTAVDNPMRESLRDGNSDARASNVEQSAHKGHSLQPHLQMFRSREDVPKCPLYDVFLKSRSAGSRISHNSADDAPLAAKAVKSVPLVAFLQVEKAHEQMVSAASMSTAFQQLVQFESPVSVFFQWLPRYQYDIHITDIRYRIIKAPLVLGSRKKLWFFGSIFTIMLGVHYTFLIYYTSFFRLVSGGGSTSDSKLIALFLLYVIVCTFLRVIIKRLGMECDKLKMNTTSMFFIAEFFCLMYYYLFYRVLFESIPDWGTFFALEILHLSFEWICYPLRASESFNRFISRRPCGRGWCGNFVEDLFFPYGLDLMDWQYFVSLDFGIRCFVIVASGISFTVSLISVSYFPWLHNALAQSGSHVFFTLALVLVSVAIEIVNAFVINHIFFKNKNLSVFKVTIDCFQDNRFAFVTTVLAGSLIMNPITSFTTDNNF